MLSTDIAQIARNWYSTGINEIVNGLQESLEKILKKSMT